MLKNLCDIITKMYVAIREYSFKDILTLKVELDLQVSFMTLQVLSMSLFLFALHTLHM